jgi:hypothetical protein
MRVLARSFLIVAASLILTPSSQDLHNRYGAADMERFSARPGISLTVQYGSDHLVCQAIVEPPQPLIHQEQQVPLMSSEGVSEVLEEIAPISTRGKEVNSFVVVSGCNEARTTEYENVSIMRSAHTCDPLSQNQDVRTTITFTRDICPQMNPQFNRLQ